ncbi:hypothetical protein [Kitasatospora herbaricolor]|uniref:Uncharacterized protein n=1 Tax=Kitasatospora herbaricolor TaxID=68217 RepID=A0ABZ1WA06_9ACTN|nr:hypothetical protein [Kitasatospora herbaricolor]
MIPDPTGAARPALVPSPVASSASSASVGMVRAAESGTVPA